MRTVSPELQAAIDAEHLRLLQIGYYILGAMTLLRILWLAFIAVMFCFMGTISTFATHHAFENEAGNNLPPQFFFVFIPCFFAVMIFFSLAFVCLEFYAAHCLKTRRNILLIQIVAALYCISLPWGTAVGACTFMVLGRPSVRALFR